MDKMLPIEADAQHKEGRFHAFARMTDARGTRTARADATTYQESVHKAIDRLLADEGADDPVTRRARVKVASALWLKGTWFQQPAAN
jgi:hypothetical protein